jgi:Zn-dependent protease with chaperone function
VRSARSLYRVNVAAGVIALAVVGVALAVAIRAVDFSHASLDAIASACQHVVPSHLGVGDVLVLVLGSVSIAVAALGLRAFARQLRAQRRVLRRLRISGPGNGQARGALLVSSRRPQAFCAGYLRPRIYVSTATVEALRDDELAAVVAHERHHARRRDPLRVLVVEVLGDALFFLPIMRRLRERYRALAELAADEAAVRTTGGRAALASALLTFGESEPPGVIAIAPERVDHLLGARPRWELPLSLVAGGAVSLLALLALLVGAARASGPGGLSLPLLTAQACMVAMTIAPMVAGASLLLLTKRVLTSSRR